MGKILSFWAQQSWNFWNRTCISDIMSIWNWCFSRGLDQEIFGVLLLELQLIFTPLSLNIFIQYFAVKWNPPCWTKQHRTFFTGDLSTRDVEAEAGSGPFSVEAEARKFYCLCFHIGYLTWRVTWRKFFFHFPMCIKWWSCTISLNEHVISVVRENDIKHN